MYYKNCLFTCSTYYFDAENRRFYLKCNVFFFRTPLQKKNNCTLFTPDSFTLVTSLLFLTLTLPLSPLTSSPSLPSLPSLPYPFQLLRSDTAYLTPPQAMWGVPLRSLTAVMTPWHFLVLAGLHRWHHLYITFGDVSDVKRRSLGLRCTPSFFNRLLDTLTLLSVSRITSLTSLTSLTSPLVM